VSNRYYFSSRIPEFIHASRDGILGQLAGNSGSSVEREQIDAWGSQIDILQKALGRLSGKIFFEYSIPRMGRRIDTVLISNGVIFVLEFKVGAQEFRSYDVDQVVDYALDLKNFHEKSHSHYIAPILIATESRRSHLETTITHHGDRVFTPILSNAENIESAISLVFSMVPVGLDQIDDWQTGRYRPTPTIIEAARYLYQNHNVEEISRNEAGTANLASTTSTIEQIIRQSRDESWKSIVFVTGVPGAGKTLVGLNVSTTSQRHGYSSEAVFLSGNGPLVNILREALAREDARSRGITKSEALRKVKAFIQNVHHFRDDCLNDDDPPVEHVAVFDEAQRAWDQKTTANFMKRRKGRSGFNQSEPEFLISCLDRHNDWAAIICLVGGGQEINTGEAGISEWILAIQRSFPKWKMFLSPRISDSEYCTEDDLKTLNSLEGVHYQEQLHLSVSMRSFRAENVSLLIKQLLDLEGEKARETFGSLSNKYPVRVTRDLSAAKEWLRTMARGTERFGVVASSQAERLRPHAINVRSPMDPVSWFLNDKHDVRSSYYLEEVATEFHIQGLELDWACVTWDADLRLTPDGWNHCSFVGSKWQRIQKHERKVYLKNAYRVLLTRARQGMVIFVPPGDARDPTRNPEYYDPTFHYLRSIGFELL